MEFTPADAGLATLKSLGFDVERYHAAEIDQRAIQVRQIPRSGGQC
jgi:hypothetical protein